MAKLIAGNWKENPRSEAAAVALFRATAAAATRARAVSVAAFPPFVYLERIAELRRRERRAPVALGAQDAFWEERGPYTSEVGPRMLRSLGVWYVIIGHSERRRWMHETDTMINRKMRRALADGLTTILCVGEPPSVRRKGALPAQRFVEAQLRKDLAGVPRDAARRVVVAYEPIWAIGTGRNDRPEDAAGMARTIKAFVKKRLGAAPRVLYGGSVNGANVRDYVQLREIDGALVGGASVRAREFRKILEAVSSL